MKNVYIIYLLILTITIACEKDDNSQAQTLMGKWHQDAGAINDSDLSYLNELIFRTDGTFESSTQIVKTNDFSNVVGYIGLIIGEYQIHEYNLTKINLEFYGLDNTHEYLDRQSLILHSSTGKSPDIKYNLNRSGNTLTLIYDCQFSSALKSTCISEQTYKRRN